MSTARRPSSSPIVASPATAGPVVQGASPAAAAKVTGADGTVLIQVSRHREYPRGGVQTDSSETSLVVEVAGDLDVGTVALVRTVLSQAIRGNRHVCCDVSRVTFLAAAAVNMFFAALGEADTAGCVFTVQGVHGIAVDVFRATGLDAALASRKRSAG